MVRTILEVNRKRAVLLHLPIKPFKYVSEFCYKFSIPFPVYPEQISHMCEDTCSKTEPESSASDDFFTTYTDMLYKNNWHLLTTYGTVLFSYLIRLVLSPYIYQSMVQKTSEIQIYSTVFSRCTRNLFRVHQCLLLLTKYTLNVIISVCLWRTVIWF